MHRNVSLRTQLRFTVTLIEDEARTFSGLMKLHSYTPHELITYLMHVEKQYRRLCEENDQVGNRALETPPESMDYEARSIEIEPPRIITPQKDPMEYMRPSRPQPSTPHKSAIRIDEVHEYVDREEATLSMMPAVKPAITSGWIERFRHEGIVDGNRGASSTRSRFNMGRTRGGGRTGATTSISMLRNADHINGVDAEWPLQPNKSTESRRQLKTTGTQTLWSKAYPVIDHRSAQTQTEWRIREDDDISVDSDGTWDEEPPERIPAVQAPQIQSSVDLPEETGPLEEESPEEPTQPKEPEPLRLLKPNYFRKFSREARMNVPRGSRRSVAAMANTRRHIVERCQLKLLLDRCMCTIPNCSNRLDKKSIKITSFGFTILVKATCDMGHKFEWTSSQRVPHETASRTSLVFTLNVATHSAITISGASWSKMESFAKALRLSWEVAPSHNQNVRMISPVIRECFGLTQKEMFDTLREEQSNGGRLVLAGDGQFDSPGSCATICSYAVMALAMDEPEGGVTRKCGYILNQAVIDKRHAECKSVNMERLGLHWAMQSIRDAGLRVSELVTDDHVQIVGDFKKIAAASEERRTNEEDGEEDSAALDKFVDTLSTALIHYKPKVNVRKDAEKLLTFYEAIVHSNDIWHCAKNILKTVSTIAGTAPKREQDTYQKYAKMLRNYLWECAEKAKGNEDVFKEMWTAVASHVEGEHESCAKYDLHTKTRLMMRLDSTSAAFDRFVRQIRKVADGAEQLCRFRHTGGLECYNAMCMKYCPKRIYIPYDSMVMRRQLAALDHNHHVNRAYKTRKDGHVQLSHLWKKSTKAFRLKFAKEAKTYDYIPHLMAAILWRRCTMDIDLRYKATKSSMNPTSICSNIAPQDQQRTLAETCSSWLALNPHQADKPKGRAAKNVIHGGKRRERRKRNMEDAVEHGHLRRPEWTKRTRKRFKWSESRRQLGIRRRKRRVIWNTSNSALRLGNRKPRKGRRRKKEEGIYRYSADS